MRLRYEQAELLEQFLTSDAWQIIEELLEERRQAKLRSLITGSLSPNEYVEVCASIREVEYLRDEPRKLIRRSTRESTHARPS